MTNLKKTLATCLLPAAALSMSVFGLAAGSKAQSTEELGMDCEISVTKDRFGYTYKGLVHADHSVAGSFELNLTKRGGGTTMISQSGNFSARAGDTATLGQASFGGLPPASVEVELKLFVDGKTYICGSEAEI